MPEKTKIRHVIPAKAGIQKDGSRLDGRDDNNSIKTIVFRLFLIFLLIPLWVFLRSIYRDRIGSFGCFDDCNNMMGGYFLLAGKHLFSQIFFNHMPLMAFVSEAIQHVTKPDTIYLLIYQHRMAMIYIFMIADVFLVARFGLAGFGFALLYESTKGYVFGERFLAEGIIIYPLVYLVGVLWELIRKKRVSPIELWIAVNFTWFIIFMREPYIPLVLALFGGICWYMRKTRFVWLAVGLLVLMTIATLQYFGLQDLIFNAYTVNKVNIAGETKDAVAQGGGLGLVLFYPFFVFFKGTWNFFRHIEVGLSALLLILGAIHLLSKKGRWLAVSMGVILILANIRAVFPGTIYYVAFHHLVWYGLCIFIIAHFIVDLWSQEKMRWLSVMGGLAFICLIGYAILSPESYLHDQNLVRQTEFATNYGHYYAIGETIRLLSKPTDTLFLDGNDDLIYWQAKRFSTYQFSWYTSLMPFFPVYQHARDTMFATSPPTFYYGHCTDTSLSGPSLPASLEDKYIRLMQHNTPSCLFIRKDALSHVSSSQWDAVKQFDFSQPELSN